MSSELKRTRNNPDPFKFKKEPKDQHLEDDEIEIVEQITGGQIPFKTESNNNTNLTFDFSGLNERITRNIIFYLKGITDVTSYSNLKRAMESN